MKNEQNNIMLPKGTVFNINGYCGELLEDTLVYSPDIKQAGLEVVQNTISEMPVSNQRFYQPLTAD